MYALQWVVVAMIPYAAVCLHILNTRLNEGAHDPTQDTPSDSLAIHCRVLQNNLEQFVWFGTCLVALASLVTPSELHLFPILSVAFCVARLTYWWGYLQEGTIGRRYGVQITFSITISMLIGVLALSLTR